MSDEVKLPSREDAFRTDWSYHSPTLLNASIRELYDRPQRFFAGLARDIRLPSYGIMQREFVEALLKRAQEAHLYEPEPT